MPYNDLFEKYREQVGELAALGLSKSAIARRLGIDRGTVARILLRMERRSAAQVIDNSASVIAAAHPAIPQLTQESLLALKALLEDAGLLAPGQPLPMPDDPVVAIPDPQELLIYAPKKYERIAFVSDVHFPYHDRAALDACVSYLRDWKPDLVIAGGDWFDCFSVSDYDKDPARFQTVQQEFDSAAEAIREIDGLGSDVIFLEGNHEFRLARLINKNPGLLGLRSLEFARAAGLPKRWKWYRSQTHYKVGPLLFLHGDLRGRGGGAKHIAAWMLSKLRTSCVYGHFHRFQTFMEADYHGVQRGAFANGHLSHVPSQDYVRCPDWACGFTTVEFDHADNLFSVRQHIIVNGQFRADGRTYGG